MCSCNVPVTRIRGIPSSEKDFVKDRMKECCLRTPRPSSQHKRVLFATEGHRAGNKRQRQETEDKGETEGNKGDEERKFAPEVRGEDRYGT